MDLNRKFRCKSQNEGAPTMNSGTSRRVLTVAAVVISLLTFAGILGATEPTASVEGVVTKIDRTAKTVMVKATDGTEHTIHLVGRTVVHGGNETYKGAEEAARDLQEGSQSEEHTSELQSLRHLV